MKHILKSLIWRNFDVLGGIYTENIGEIAGISNAYQKGQCVFAGIKLGIFDAFVEGKSLSSDSLCDDLEIDQEYGFRWFMELANLGFLEDLGNRQFDITDAGKLLRKDAEILLYKLIDHQISDPYTETYLSESAMNLLTGRFTASAYFNEETGECTWDAFFEDGNEDILESINEAMREFYTIESPMSDGRVLENLDCCDIVGYTERPKILKSPAKYIQGKGVTKRIGHYFKHLGKKCMFVGGIRALDTIKDFIEPSFEEQGMDFALEIFVGECCQEKVDELVEIGKKNGVDFVCGVGGGKAIDTAKLVGNALDTRVAVVPTICATDSPCSGLSALYSKETKKFDKYVGFDRNPDIVMVDTEIIVNAPPRFLIAGIGDALATYFEGEQATIGKKISCAGGVQTLTSCAIAELCLKTLLENGRTAVLSSQTKSCSPAFEKICEANILLSGLGFESCGLAAAHSIHNGLTALEECHGEAHGRKVNIGTLCQLVMQGADKELLDTIYEFCISVNLPVTLAEIGITEKDPKILRERLTLVGKYACAKKPNIESIHNMPFPVNYDMVVDCLLTADALGKEYLKKFQKIYKFEGEL